MSIKLLRHFLFLSGKKNFTCFNISCYFYIGRADITAAATLDTRTHIITFSDFQKVVFDGMRYLSRIQILGAYLQTSAAANTRRLAPGKFCSSDLLFR